MNINLTDKAEMTQAANAALDEFVASGQHRVIPPFIAAIDGRYMVELSVFSGRLNISGVYVDEKLRGRGIGSEVLNAVLKAADNHGAECMLTPVPYGRNKGLNKVQLRKWYERHGFEKKEFGDSMIRRSVKIDGELTPRTPFRIK